MYSSKIFIPDFVIKFKINTSDKNPAPAPTNNIEEFQ